MAARQLPAMPSVADLLRLFRIPARKHLSQNFLLDLNVADRFVAAAGPLHDSHVIEVGPGPGSLTRCILKRGAPRLTAIEKDTRFLPLLQLVAECSDNRLEVLHADAMSLDYTRLLTWDRAAAAARDSGRPPPAHTTSTKIIGNLPFNISVPLLRMYLWAMSGTCPAFHPPPDQLVLAFQTEVANRIAAPPRAPERGRLSVMAQSYCDVEVKYLLPSTVFVPAPKVNATVLSFIPRPPDLMPRVPFDYMELVVRELFQFRRKILRNNLRKRLQQEHGIDSVPGVDALLEGVGLDPTARPEELQSADIVRLAECLFRLPTIDA